MVMFGRDPAWMKWAEKFDLLLDKLVKANPGAWFTVELEVDHATWAIIEKFPEDPYYEMTLPVYYKGFLWDNVRVKQIRKVDPPVDGSEIFQVNVLQKYIPKTTQ